MKVSLPHVSAFDVQLVRQYVQTFIAGDISVPVVQTDEQYLETLETEVESIKEEIYTLRLRIKNVKTFVLEVKKATQLLNSMEQEVCVAQLQEMLTERNIRDCIYRGAVIYERYVNSQTCFVNKTMQVFNDVYEHNRLYDTEPSQLAMRLIEQTFNSNAAGQYTISYKDVNLMHTQLHLPLECIIALNKCTSAERLQYIKLQQHLTPHALTILFFFTLSMQLGSAAH